VTHILFIADVIGSPGRDVVQALLPGLRRRHDIHLVICNGENSAGGFGLTRETAAGLFDAGVDVLTGGNHLWDRKDAMTYLGEEPRLVRPANMPAGTPGQGSAVFTATDGTPVGVISLLGQVFMREVDSPFRTIDAIVDPLRKKTKVIFVDFHAEATAEKVALGWHLDGRVSAVIGTHTHTQTADERILAGGTACLTDAGMTGGFDSVIGMDREGALKRFFTLLPQRLQPSTGDLRMNAVLLSVDPATGRATSIRRLQIPFQPGRAGTARILRGEEPAETVRYAAMTEVKRLAELGVAPRLALVSVGDDPASRIYLKRKHEACEQVGIAVERVPLAPGTDTAAIVAKVRALGANPDVHGILVQLPLAPPADAQDVLEAIPPAKDVDGFHPVNVGRLNLGLPALVSATPRGILELLRYHKIPLAGGHAVVLGRSNIVGRPMATLLSSKGVDMTVTLGHSRSGPGLQSLAREADLLIAAIGKPEVIDAEWVKPGATVIDVGIHRVPAPGQPKGTRLCGDVDAESVARVAGALSPVPGGVGPLTVAMVVANTVLAAARQHGMAEAERV
jgi:metallophosphoesterase (TIGR00282 family)